MSQLGDVQQEFDELLNGAETVGEAMRMCDLLNSVLCSLEHADGARDIFERLRSLYAESTHQHYALAYFLHPSVDENGPDRKLYMPNDQAHRRQKPQEGNA